jgi:hypothetical protein
MEHKKSRKKIFGKTLTIISLMVFFIIFTSAKIETTSEPYSEKESVSVKVPRIITETYNGTEYIEKNVAYGTDRCIYDTQLPHRFDYYMHIDSGLSNDSRIVICTANVSNLEKKPGNFTFYAEIMRSDGLRFDFMDQTKEIPANSTVSFIWTYQTEKELNAVCALKPEKIPIIQRCEFKPEGIYEIRKYPVNVIKQRNKTIYEDMQTTVDVEKARERQTYVNRVFGYNQFFYLGY